MNALLKMISDDTGELYINGELILNINGRPEHTITIVELDDWFEFDYEGKTYDLNVYEIDTSEAGENEKLEWVGSIYEVIDKQTDTYNSVCSVAIYWSEALDDCKY